MAKKDNKVSDIYYKFRQLTVSAIIVSITFFVLFTIVFSKIRSERDYVNNRIVELQNNIEAISIDIPIVGERRAITYSYNDAVVYSYTKRICAQSAIKYILDYLGLEFKATEEESKVFLEKVKKDK